MTETERLAAIEAIRDMKARYWRGVDSCDGALVRSVLAEDCVLDFMGCCTDPASGIDHMPWMNMVLKGRESWQVRNSGRPRRITVHHGHQHEIAFPAPGKASAVWAFSDRFFMPPGAPFARFTGYGHYHDTYVLVGGEWLIQTSRVSRLWAEVS